MRARGSARESRALLRHAFAAVAAVVAACAALCALPAALADVGGVGSAAYQNSTGARATASGGRFYPEPSSGPPRQFPLSPSPSKTATTPRHTVRPPAPRAPSPSTAKVVPTPPRPVPTTPTPRLRPTPTTPSPTPTPTLQIALPPAAYHPVPHKRLSTVLVLFVVAIVPVSLARVRRR